MFNITTMITHYPPSPDLAHALARCWYIAPPGFDGVATHEVGPSCGVDLVYRLSDAGWRLVLLGMRTKKAHVELEGRSTYMGFRFRTGVVPGFTEMSFAELVDQCVDIECIDGVSLDEVAERIGSLDDPRERLAVLEDCVRRAGVAEQTSRCIGAARTIEERGGMVTVQGAAAVAGVHPRTLERYFRKHFTITPKQFIRTARLNHAASQLVAEHHESMAGVAQESGYADQAHMAREFRQVADLKPRTVNPEYTGRVEGDPPGVVHRYRK